METETYYDVLGLRSDASHRQVVKAFAELAERYQKEASDPVARERFQQVKAAYQTLTNYESRLRYNMERGLADPPRPVKASAPSGILGQLGVMLPDNWPVLLPWLSLVIGGNLAYYLLTGDEPWFSWGMSGIDHVIYLVGCVLFIGLAWLLSRNDEFE